MLELLTATSGWSVEGVHFAQTKRNAGKNV